MWFRLEKEAKSELVDAFILKGDMGFYKTLYKISSGNTHNLQQLLKYADAPTRSLARLLGEFVL